MKTKPLPKYKIEANKQARHKLTKAYAKKQAKKQRRKDLEQWKLDVKERDNWTCRICKKDLKSSPHNCHAHHILDKKNYKQFSTDIKNGITLCYRDHKVGPLAPHMNALFFSEWLKENDPEIFEYLIEALAQLYPK